MKNENCCWFLKYALLAVIVIIIAITAVSCYAHSEVTDPAANTPGYKLFTGKTNGFRVSFEYPDSWSRVSLESISSNKRLVLLPPDCSVIIASVLSKSKGGDYANADEVMQFELGISSTRLEFKVLSRSQIQLGQGTGEEVSYSYSYRGEGLPDMPIVYAEPGETVIDRILDIDYKGWIYEVNLLAGVSKYEEANLGFQHLIDTFKFLK